MTVTTFEAIGLTTALELLEKAVAARGRDYRYTDRFCTTEYVSYPKSDTDDNGNPFEDSDRLVNCLIAEALHQHGVDTWELEELDASLPELAGFTTTTGESNRFKYNDTHTYVHRQLFDLCDADLAMLGVQLTEDAARVWWAAQRVQDDNHPWGEALDKATEVAMLLAAS